MRHRPKPSSMRDYNPNRKDRFTGHPRGKREEQNPLEGLESEKEIIIRKKDESFDSDSEYEENDFSDSFSEEDEDENEEDSESDSFEENPPISEKKDPDLTSPKTKNSDNTDLSKDLEKVKFSSSSLDAVYSAETKVLEGDRMQPITPDSSAGNSSSEPISERVLPALDTTSSQETTPSLASVSHEKSQATSNSPSLESALINASKTEEEPLAQTKEDFSLKNLLEKPEQKKQQESLDEDIYARETKILDITNSPGDAILSQSPHLFTSLPPTKEAEETPLLESQTAVSSEGNSATTTPVAQKTTIEVPNKLSPEVHLERLVQTRLSPGVPPSKKNRRGKEGGADFVSEIHPDSSAREGGVVSFRPKNESQNTLAAKLIQASNEKPFAEGLQVATPIVPEKVLSGQMRPMKKNKPLPQEETEEEVSFGSGLIEDSKPKAQKPSKPSKPENEKVVNGKISKGKPKPPSEEIEDDEGPISLLSEEDEVDFPDMNSLVNSLDKGGEEKLREFRRRGTLAPQNQPGGVVQAYSSSYLEEQSNKPPLTPTPLKEESPEKLQKSSHDFRGRRDDRGRKDQDRNRNKEDRYSSNRDSSNRDSSNRDSTKPSSEIISSQSSQQNRESYSDRQHFRGKYPPKESRPTDASRPYSQSSSFEPKYPREERSRTQSVPATATTSLLTLDLNHADSRRWIIVLLFFILVALMLNFIHSFLPQETYRHYYHIAEECIQYQDWNLAKEMLKSAIRAEPSHTKARLALAYVHLREWEEGNTAISMVSIYQEIRLIRNILNLKYPGQPVNDSPKSIEGQFLNSVYQRFYDQWDRNIIDVSKLSQDINFKVLSELWTTDATQWQTTIQNIQHILHALKLYTAFKKTLPADLKILTEEQNPETKKAFLESARLLDGWGMPLNFKSELWKGESSDHKKQEYKVVLTSFGADHQIDDQEASSGWNHDITKTDYLTFTK